MNIVMTVKTNAEHDSFLSHRSHSVLEPIYNVRIHNNIMICTVS